MRVAKTAVIEYSYERLDAAEGRDEAGVKVREVDEEALRTMKASERKPKKGPEIDELGETVSELLARGIRPPPA